LAALAAAPATRTAPAPPPSREDLDALHRRAVEFMRANQYDKAGVLLEKVYAATPPAERSRKLVLNHAILDLTQKRLVIRAVKDLTEYLVTHRDDDEFATNVLAAALNVSADNPRWKRGDVWQNAYREWNRRNFNLDRSRPGYRRWGAKWITEAEQAELDARRAKLQGQIEDTREFISRTSFHIESLLAQQANARDVVQQTDQIRKWLWQVRANPTASPMDQARANYSDQAVRQNQWEAAAEAWKLDREARDAVRELGVAQVRLKELQGSFPKPEWPTRFQPVDLDAPDPVSAATTRFTTAGATQPTQLYPDSFGTAPATQPAVPFAPRPRR
jgi:hypothetical protein